MNDHKIYFVGGFVRDNFLGLESNDIDFVFVINNINISIEEGFGIMNNWLSYEGFKIYLTKPSMLTIRAKFPDTMKYKTYSGLTADFVLARKEEYNEDSRQPIVKIGNLEDDLERRDFTVNAMAMDLEGNLIDLFNGLNDLREGILQTPLDPEITLNDDPLRILRAIRFSITKQLNFSAKLEKAIYNEKNIEKLFNLISKDRIREELHKMFAFSTVKTIKMLNKIEERVPLFIERLFSQGLWLKPTNEKLKNDK